MIYPKSAARAPLSPHVPDRFAVNYIEACVVLADSPKASAALSRRCLQDVLRENASVKPNDLLAEAVDAIRNVGNFAAHPIKSTNTGEILDVEPGEAEWLLDVLEGLFDSYFVHPHVIKAKRAALDQKLQEAGKPPMK